MENVVFASKFSRRGRDFTSGGHANGVIACVVGVTARDDEVNGAILTDASRG